MEEEILNHDDILNDDEFWKELGLDPALLEMDKPEKKPEEKPAAEKTVEAEEKLKKKNTSGKKAKKKAKTGKGKKPVEEPAPEPEKPLTFLRVIVNLVAIALCVVLTAGLVGAVALMSAGKAGSAAGSASDAAIMDKFDMIMTNEISNALDGVLSIEKVYWLSDSDLVAPKPKAENFGKVTTPAELSWLLEEAKDLIGDAKLLFNENTPAWDRDGITYYYDETILVITWKQVVDRSVYTISEVRIAHPSQFRRFLAGGEFGSDKLYVTTDMATSVNAVVATSGDYYRYRRNGAVVYEGQLRRFEGRHVDSCFIDENGDMHFAYRGDLTTEEEALKFVEDRKIRFSMAFGPILVDNGVACPPTNSYSLGEIFDRYSRAGLCQMGQLHYLLVSAGGGGGVHENRHTIGEFAKHLESFGVQKAYALDGGQTTVIAMDGKLINNVDFGYQRQISDIIYFATALPEGE